MDTQYKARHILNPMIEMSKGHRTNIMREKDPVKTWPTVVHHVKHSPRRFWPKLYVGYKAGSSMVGAEMA